MRFRNLSLKLDNLTWYYKVESKIPPLVLKWIDLPHHDSVLVMPNSCLWFDTKWIDATTPGIQFIAIVINPYWDNSGSWYRKKPCTKSDETSTNDKKVVKANTVNEIDTNSFTASSQTMLSSGMLKLWHYSFSEKTSVMEYLTERKNTKIDLCRHCWILTCFSAVFQTRSTP